jgi:hypothetical protein
MEAYSIICEVPTAQTSTHTHVITNAHVYICSRGISVFKGLGGERQNFSKSWSLLRQIIPLSFLVLDFCDENCTYNRPSFSVLSWYQRKRDRERVKERDAVLNNSSNQAVARVAVRRPRERRCDEKHCDILRLVCTRSRWFSVAEETNIQPVHRSYAVKLLYYMGCIFCYFIYKFVA